MTELTIHAAQNAMTRPVSEVDANAYQLALSGDHFVIPSTHRLIEEKSSLVGIPHVITAVTYQLPTQTRPLGYVSVEALVADAETLERYRMMRRIPESSIINNRLFVDALERIVYNDGSTGIRRTLTKLFEDQGMLVIGSDLPESGPLGQCRYDIPWPQWTNFSQSEMQSDVAVPRFTKLPNGNPLIIPIPNGLRSSGYTVDGEDVTTFFLA